MKQIFDSYFMKQILVLHFITRVFRQTIESNHPKVC